MEGVKEKQAGVYFEKEGIRFTYVLQMEIFVPDRHRFL